MPSRPGGRTARTREGVFAALDALLAAGPPGSLSVPIVASKAGVTASTIYRRWGQIDELLASYAVQKVQASIVQAGHIGSGSDLEEIASIYAHELSSPLGRYIAHLLVVRPKDKEATSFVSHLKMEIHSAAHNAFEGTVGEPDIEDVIDYVFAPITLRVLTGQIPTTEMIARFVAVLKKQSCKT